MTKEIKATAPTPQDWIELVRENERLKLQGVKEAALVMANARRIVKRTTMSNAKLFMELHGSGYGTARSYCRDTLGLDPDSKETSYNEMMDFIGEQNK